MISQQTIQQIQQRVEIVEVLSHFISLKRRGVNQIGLCPFHGEKTPSFTVSPAKQIYKCFGCGRSGSAITFLMEHEKMSYPESLKWLAEKYGIPIEETVQSEEQKKQVETSNSLAILNKFAANFFHKQLLEHPDGKLIGLSYLKERQFEQSIIDEFQLGFSPKNPSRNFFYQVAKAQQFDDNLLIASGLVRQRNNLMEDTYAGRIIFPIHTHNGKVCGFAARMIGSANAKAPKYINTPQNDLYNKSTILYGIHIAKTHSIKASFSIIVEGYTDVISLSQRGIKNVVASGGTSLTKEQIMLLKKIGSRVLIFYDSDEAGINATIRAVNLLLNANMEVDVLQIPGGEDPDSFMKTHTADSFNTYIATYKKNFLDFLIATLIKPEQSIEEKSQNINQIAEVLAQFHKIEEQIKRQAYIKHAAKQLDIEVESFNRLVNLYIQRKVYDSNRDTKNDLAAQEATAMPSNTSSPLATLSTLSNVTKDDYMRNNIIELLRILIYYGKFTWDKDCNVAHYIFGELDKMNLLEEIKDKTLQTILQSYRTNMENDIYLDSHYLLYHEDIAIRNVGVSVCTDDEKPNHAWKELIADFDKDISEDYKKATHTMLALLTIRLIKKLVYLNQDNSEFSNDFNENEQVILTTHKTLMDWQKQISEAMGISIIK